METIPLIDVRCGDIVACWGTDWVSRRISLVTSSLRGPRELRWGPSHVAIIGRYNGREAWYESTTKCKHPCLATGDFVQGFQVQCPYERVSDYLERRGVVRVYRPSPFASRALNVDLLNELLRVALTLNLQYSYKGAALSATSLLKHSRLIPGVDLDDVFCSEIVSVIAQNLGLQNKSDPRHYTPASLLRTLCQPGTYQLNQELRA